MALEERELPALDELERRGRANGLQGLTRLGPEQIREYEPHVRGLAGLHVPETGIVDYKAVTAKYGELVREAGGDVRLTAKVVAVHPRPGELVLDTRLGEVREISHQLRRPAGRSRRATVRHRSGPDDHPFSR